MSTQKLLRSVHVLVDEETQISAKKVLEDMGMSMSDAVRLFLKRVAADQTFPLELKVPNATTRAAMEESRALIKARHARFATADELFNDLEKNSHK
jgi:DNA-damage-inducible protein J